MRSFYFLNFEVFAVSGHIKVQTGNEAPAALRSQSLMKRPKMVRLHVERAKCQGTPRYQTCKKRIYLEINHLAPAAVTDHLKLGASIIQTLLEFLTYQWLSQIAWLLKTQCSAIAFYSRR